MKALREEMKIAAKGAVHDGAMEIFTEYGDILDSFGWRQYTPYFNDGDPCVFGVWDLAIIAKDDLADVLKEYGEDAVEDHRSDWAYEGSPRFSSYSSDSKVSDRYGTIDPRFVECQKACEAVYAAATLDESIAKDIFGDHVTVTFTAKGVEVEEYYHD